jgi:plastocyanin
MQPHHHDDTPRTTNLAAARNRWRMWSAAACLRGCVYLLLVLTILAPQAVPQARLAAAQAGAQAPARSGALRGRVEIGRVLGSAARRPGIADLGGPPDRDASDRQRSVVYLESAPRAAFDQVEPARAAMDQRNETFVPHVLAITAGTVVEFPNSDRFYHNVFSLSKPARFDLGRYAVGKSKSVRFNQPGIVRVFCEIHSHMNAFILVFGHPFFAMTDSDGRYRINNVPAGTYNVIAWNEGIASEPKAVTIPAGGLAELDFGLR